MASMLDANSEYAFICGEILVPIPKNREFIVLRIIVSHLDRNTCTDFSYIIAYRIVNAIICLLLLVLDMRTALMA